MSETITETKENPSSQDEQLAMKRMLEREVISFWEEHGHNLVIHAARTDVVVAPKPLVGDIVNPEITKQFLQTILAQISAQEIVEETIVVTEQTVQFFNQAKQLLFTTPNQPFLQNTHNAVTDRIGVALSQRENVWGDRYVIPKDDGHYTFADILEPSLKFLQDHEVWPSTNPLKDIIRTLVREKRQS